MITIDPMYVCDLPISRQEVGFPEQEDGGNAVLLVAQDMQPAAQLLYQQAGCICEGVRIASCSLDIYAILEQMRLRWCPWPEYGFTLAVLDHSRIGMVADRLVLSRLNAHPSGLSS